MNDANSWETSAADETLRRRALLKSQPNCHFVDPSHFCKLAVSFRRLERRDDVAGGLLGLFDEATNEHFFVEQEAMYA